MIRGRKRPRCRAILAAAALALAGGAAGAAPPTIVAMGDSLTQGYGLPPEEGFVAQLDDWLAEHGIEAELVNAGVSGDTTAGGLSRIDWTLAEDPDAMIVALGGNDMLRGIDPAETRANLDGILASAREAGVAVLLAGMPAPGNFGPEYRREFAAIYPELSEEYGTLYHENLLAPVTEGAGAAQADPALMQDDSIHPNAEGVARIVAAIGPKVAELAARARDDGA